MGGGPRFTPRLRLWDNRENGREERPVLDFEKIVEYRNKHNRFARKLGI